ncbi:MAG TPA: integrase arm-type DNA-binding domain-containing protein [Methylocystis sp.]|jgi:integrase
MAINILNDAQIRAAKPQVRLAKGSRGKDANLQGDQPAPRLTKMPDGGGLMLWIEPTGAKRWRMAYRFGGKQKSLAFGTYPEVGLKEARAARDGARKLLAAGVDPSTHKRATRAALAIAQGNTFAAVAAELLEKKRAEGCAPSTMEKLEWLLALVAPALGEQPIGEIKPPEILAVLRQIERRGKYNTANRARAVVGEVFRLAIASGRADDDPSLALRGALVSPTIQRRAAIIEPEPFGQLLRAIDGYTGAPETRLAMQLLALTFVRPGELRAAEWSEFFLDAEQPTWVIPPAKTKMRREHKVPLAPQSVAIVRELRTLSRGGKYLFPGGRTITRPMSENAITAAMRRMGYGKDEVCAHGFRATASSMLNAARTPPQNAKGEPQPVRRMWDADAIERQLAHVEGNAVRRAYNRDDFWEERVQMMAWWADRCDELRADMPASRAA